MHVLTLIGCVLFSDVGPREAKEGGGRGWGVVCVCACAGAFACVCVIVCVA